ncbi:hypothetical protein MMC10_002774 [Thelotrema lepadinum]|nr:hypothetical protein [Thelotrema lepadinum]
MSIKTKELAKKRQNCDSLREELLVPLKDTKLGERERVKHLLKDSGRRVLPQGIKKDRRRDRLNLPRKKLSTLHEEILSLAGLSAANVQRHIDQSSKDISISSTYFQSVEDKFRGALDAKSIKYKYATLFSNLVTERLSENGTSTQDPIDGLSDSESGSFERIGQPTMLEQRKEWERLVFTPRELDESNIIEQLEQTFSSLETRQALDTLRNNMEDFCNELLEPNQIDVHEIRICIDGLIASDLLSSDQTAMLKEIRESSTNMSEIAYVLNLRLAAINEWNWETDTLELEMRRQLNGKYRVFMQEEITQAIFLYHVGIKFAVAFREYLEEFYESFGWKKPSSLGHTDQEQFDYYIGSRSSKTPSIETTVQEKFRDEYFMSMLPKSADEVAQAYDPEDDSPNNSHTSSAKKAVQSKQSLLHLMTTEGLLADRLGQELFVLQTDFRWFGPSLSHSTIAATLKFFGVTDIWLSFFQTFLKAPLKFVHDGPNGQIRVRQCGVPMSHILSDFFGEAILFCVDFTVNQATEGRPMFRLHDDVWLWGTQNQCIAGWKAFADITKTLGIEINKEKTGSARITSGEPMSVDAEPGESPIGPLRWGFLVIKDGGKFEVEEKKIESHISEFRRQLAATKSVLSWIKAYNAYCHFLTFNCCHPANCFGRQHVDGCLSVLKRVHEALFPSTNGNVAEYVKQMIHEKHDINDLPDGFIYFPVSLGGVGLHNPFVSLQNMRDNIEEDPSLILNETLEDDEVEYRRLSELFKNNGATDKHAIRSRPTEFMAFEQWTRYRRERSNIFLKAWKTLQAPAEEEHVQRRDEVVKLLDQLPKDRAGGQFSTWGRMSPYWKSVMDMYGPQVAEVFGSLEIVEKNLLPLGMMNLFTGKMRWES